MSSLAPGFLVAAPILRDPNFAGSVVLMVEHSEQGALGFVVNRVANASLQKVLGQLGMADIPIEARSGRDVGRPRLSADRLDRVRCAVARRAGSRRRVDGDRLARRERIEAVPGRRGERRGPGRAMLVQGYAGWGPGQLELELRQGVWIPVDLDARVIFDAPAERRWSAALNVLGIHPASLPRTQIAQA